VQLVGNLILSAALLAILKPQQLLRHAAPGHLAMHPLAVGHLVPRPAVPCGNGLVISSRSLSSFASRQSTPYAAARGNVVTTVCRVAPTLSAMCLLLNLHATNHLPLVSNPSVFLCQTVSTANSERCIQIARALSKKQVFYIHRSKDFLIHNTKHGFVF